MNRQRSGFGLYAAFMVIIVLAMFYITGKISAGSSPSQQKFETAVKDGKVTSAQIVQNKEVPTGSVVVREQGGDSYTVNVTDVNAAIGLLEDADVTYTVQNVQRDSIFMTSVLPALLLGMILLFGMSMMNRSMGGGGGGGSSSYSISVDKNIDNGSVTVSPKSASSGRTVTITVKADEGYELDELTVTDKNGDEIELTDKGDGLWECLTRPGRKTRTGVELTFGDGLLTATVEAVQPDGNRLIRFHYEGIFLEILDKLGTMPLPPYIKEKLDDPERYQTVYSKTPGSAAAPTAGLHFTTELLDALKAKGVKLAFVTLHVGLGTFRPVKEDEITDHIMHSEYYIMDEETAGIINDTRAAGGKIWAVGTTASRTLETIAADDGTVRAQSGWTDIFIYPGYKFKAVDHLVTNFHLPESTLMMLISAFATREMVMNAYQEAIKEEYRFFSFGDSMLLY